MFLWPNRFRADSLLYLADNSGSCKFVQFVFKRLTDIVRIGISGWDSCLDDTLTLYNDPDLNSLRYNERTVYIP